MNKINFYCLDIWSNKKFFFSRITVLYTEKGSQNVQVYDNNVLYPSQLWFADKITIETDKHKINYENKYISIQYNQPCIIIE